MNRPKTKPSANRNPQVHEGLQKEILSLVEACEPLSHWMKVKARACSGLALLILLLLGWVPHSLAESGATSSLPKDLLTKCPPSKDLILEDGKPGLTCCPKQPYVLCSQSDCTLLAGVAICDCVYMGIGVSLATPYSSSYDSGHLLAKEGPAPWTGQKKVEDVCQYMEELQKVDKVLSTFNTYNYNYKGASYLCEESENMIWAQCDGAVCEVVDSEGKSKSVRDGKPQRDKAICTCQAVQSPAVLVGPVKDGKPSEEFAQKFCGAKPKLAEIDYPEDGVHIALEAKPELLKTPLYQYLFSLYAPNIFDVIPKESLSIKRIDPVESKNH